MRVNIPHTSQAEELSPPKRQASLFPTQPMGFWEGYKPTKEKVYALVISSEKDQSPAANKEQRGRTKDQRFILVLDEVSK